MNHIAIDARIINSSTGRYVERLISHLEKIDQRNRYTILVRQNDRDFWRPSASNFAVTVAEFDNYSFAEQVGFRKFLDQLGPDLVHFCMPQQPVLYSGKKITTIHDLTLLNTYNSDKNWLVFHAKQQVGKLVFRRIAKTNQHIITPSKFTRDAYRKFSGIASEKISVTYESADPPITNSQPVENLPFERFLLYVGQQSDYKNVPRLAAAHQKLLNTQPDLGLVLAGKLNQSAQNNKALFEKNGYKNIYFSDFIPDPQLAWLYQHAAVYVFPSLMEGFGLPGLEAMQYQLPVVSSSATCLPEIYGQAAEYFDPNNPDDIAKTIEYVLEDPDRRNELIANGKQQLKNYSWQKMARQTHEIYMKVLST